MSNEPQLPVLDPIVVAASALLAALDEHVPTNTVHWAVEDTRRAVSMLIFKAPGVTRNAQIRPISPSTVPAAP
jgi:hypothetical protein